MNIEKIRKNLLIKIIRLYEKINRREDYGR